MLPKVDELEKCANERRLKMYVRDLKKFPNSWKWSIEKIMIINDVLQDCDTPLVGKWSLLCKNPEACLIYKNL